MPAAQVKAIEGLGPGPPQRDLLRQRFDKIRPNFGFAGAYREVAIRTDCRAKRHMDIKPGAGSPRLTINPESVRSTDTNASWGIWTDPTSFMRALPFFCFSKSLRFREMSPP